MFFGSKRLSEGGRETSSKENSLELSENLTDSSYDSFCVVGEKKAVVEVRVWSTCKGPLKRKLWLCLARGRR